jgi:hypothetical protein
VAQSCQCYCCDAAALLGAAPDARWPLALVTVLLSVQRAGRVKQAGHAGHKLLQLPGVLLAALVHVLADSEVP